MVKPTAKRWHPYAIRSRQLRAWRGKPGPLVPALVVAMTILLPALITHADDWSGAVPAKARALAERGRALHDAGDYASAITAFTQAYVIAPSPALLFNLAQAYRLKGDCDDAALMYQRYLATGPGPDGRALAETHLTSVERCVHKLSLHIPVETAGVAAATPLSASATEDIPPSHTAQIEKDTGVGLAIGGSVALVAATYYAIQARDAENQVAAAYGKGAKWKDIAPIDQQGKTAASSAQILAGGAAVGIGGGIVMYLLGRHTEQSQISVAPVAHGVTAGMSWAW